MLAHVWNFLAESEMVYFSPVKACNPGYAPLKRQNLRINAPVFAFGRKFKICS
jgi:hypothetical protein